MTHVIFQTQNRRIESEFNFSLTAQMVIKGLPIEGKVKLWGDEFFIDTVIQASDVHAGMDVNVGDIAYRHEDKRICVFFGKTPLSTTDKPVPEFPVVVIGKVLGLPSEIKGINEGEAIKVFVQAVQPEIKSEASNDRKLTQSEIDLLVKKLLAEKSAKAAAINGEGNKL